MNEKDIGAKTGQYLNLGLAQIEEDKLIRLKAARARAMDGYREPVTVMGLALAGGPTGWIKDQLRNPWMMIGSLVVGAALALGAVNLMQDPNAEIGDLDAALLTGELPVDAFLDKDFDSWLKGAD
jgi:hypothetical protein